MQLALKNGMSQERLFFTINTGHFTYIYIYITEKHNFILKMTNPIQTVCVWLPLNPIQMIPLVPVWLLLNLIQMYAIVSVWLH